MKKIRNIFSGNEGFTLIELLIVIVIIGVLAAIAVPNIAGLVGSADKEVVRANMRTLLTEIEARRASGNTTSGTGSGNFVAIDELNAYVELGNMDLDSFGFVDSKNAYDDYKITAKVTDDNGTYTYTIENGQLTTSNS